LPDEDKRGLEKERNLASAITKEPSVHFKGSTLQWWVSSASFARGYPPIQYETQIV